MAQVSYGTITITDTNDISRIYVEYCRSTSNQLSGTTVPNITRAWGETTPEWVDGEYIWQRAVIEKSGTLAKTYGKPVCLTGAQGETGDQGPQGPQGGTGAAGRSLTSTTTQYTTAATSATITQSNMGNYTWSNNVPDYNANTPAYWVRITNTYSNPSSTQYIIYKDNGITDAVKTSHDANTTAATANSTANTANQTANTANNTANNANTKADQAVTNVNNLQAKLKYYWVNEVNHTNGVSGWIKPNYPVGTYAASGISGTTFDSENSSTYGYNTWYANGINLRYNAINLGQLTGTSLIFYHPSTSSQGGKAMELTGSALKFYDSTGSVAQATFGGTQATISGTINVYDGKIGNGSNYWYIGNYTDYNQNDSAIIKSIGTASIQLNETNTWRIATNRIHTAWAPESGTDAYKLHFPIFVDSENNNKHWDFGLHLPTSNSDKFLYIRNAASTQSLDNLLNDLDDAGYNYWTYKFYVDSEGNLHAGDIYSHGTLISGTSAPYLLKSGGTMTGSITMSNGGKFVGDVTGNVSGSASKLSNTSKIGDTNKPVYFTANGVPAAISYEINKSVPSNALFTDENVKSTEANTTKLWLVGSDTSGTHTGTLKYDSGVYITTTAGTVHATTFEGNLSGTASRATADADGNTIKTTYLKLSGGNVTGAVTFGSSVSADELTVGDLVVNGNASFTNNAQFNTINGVAVGSSPKFTDTVTTVTVTGNGNAITSITASNGAISATKGSTFLTSYTETDPIFVASAAHGITSSDISNWNSKTSNTGTVTSVRVQASSPLQSSSSAASSTTLNTTISFTNQNVNTVLAGPTSGSTAAAPTFRKLVAADIPDISGTYYLANNPSGYTTNTGTVTSIRVQASSPLTSTANTASSTTLDTTIKFSNQNKNLVLAGPSSGNTAAAPTFRSLVADDIPSISKSKISDFPASLKNPNAIRLNLFNETAARAAANQGTATSYVDYDGSTANQSFSAAGKNAITSIGISGDTLSWVRADGSSGSSTVTITASVASGATVLTDTNGNAISTTGNTTPVWFDGGIPKDVTGIAFSLLPTGTGASNVAVGNHSHGNITNGGDITTTVTIASGDRLVINDESESKINNSSITFGTSTTTFLSNKGTWETPSAAGSATNATNDSDGNPINTTYIKKSIGTAAGDIIYWSASGIPTRLAKGSNGQVLKLADGVPTWGTDNNTTYSAGTGLSLTGTTFANTGVTGVKGNAESSYRTGQVNLTPTNLGAVRGNSYLFYGTCDTEAATAEKEVTCADFTSNDLQPGAVINVYFTVTNSAAVANLQLNVNGTGAKHIKYIYNGSYSNIPGVGYIKLNQVYQFTYDGTYWIVQMIYNTDDDWRVRADYGRFTAGMSGLLPYALVMKTSDGRWESITTTSTTAKTKVKNTTGFLLDAIFFRNVNNTVAEGSVDSNWQMNSSNICDARYHLNIENTEALKLNVGKSLYLVGTIGSDGLFYLDDTWWAQNLPTTADGKYYIYLGTIYDWYRYNLDVFHPVYKFVDGKVRNVSLDAILVNNHTVNSDVPSNAKFTDTWNALSTSQAGYVTKAPNDTAKFLRGDATWAAVTKANVGLSNVENTALSTWTGSSNIKTVGTITSGTWNGSAIPVANGGTGATTAANAINALLGGLPTWTANPTDTTYFVRQDTGGTASYGKVTFSTLWNYISGKISSSGTYVTIGTDQTITANQKTFNGATRWSITNSTTGSKYGACNYDATLDALVFSFGTI